MTADAANLTPINAVVSSLDVANFRLAGRTLEQRQERAVGVARPEPSRRSRLCHPSIFCDAIGGVTGTRSEPRFAVVGRSILRSRLNSSRLGFHVDHCQLEAWCFAFRIDFFADQKIGFRAIHQAVAGSYVERANL